MDISKNVRSLTCQLGLLIAAGLLCTTANAQSDDEESAKKGETIDQVTVTARKREERLQDIPTSAAALTRDFMDSLNPIEDIRELTDLIPGITMNDRTKPRVVPTPVTSIHPHRGSTSRRVIPSTRITIALCE